MNRYRSLAALVTALALSVPLSLLAAAPAGASPSLADGRPTGGRAPYPGGNVVWGASLDMFSTSATCVDSGGGWSTREFKAEYNATDISAPVNPQILRLCEPMRSATTSTQFALGATRTALKNERTGLSSIQWRIGAISPTPTIKFVCANSQWSDPSTLFVRESSIVLQGGTSTSSSAVSEGGYGNAGVSSAQCPFLVSIKMPVAMNTQSGSAQYPIRYSNWSAESWYTNKVYDLTSPISAICSGAGATSTILLCDGIVPLDGTVFTVACAGAPTLTWGDWAFLNNWVAHFAECLFNPLNGFDRTGQVRGAWTASPVGNLIDSFNNAGQIVSSPGQCGVIFSMEIPFSGVPFVVNTCEWGDYSPIRNFAKVVILMFGALGCIIFALNIITSIMSRKVISPLSDEKDSDQ